MKAGWERRRLGELLQKTGTTDPTKTPEGSFTYIDVSSVSNETFSITETSELLGKDAPSRARRSVRSGDVIFATIRPTLKRIAIVPDELNNAVCSTGYFVLRGGTKIDNRYLFYWLFSDEFQVEMEARQKGASYPAVNDSDIREQYVPVPSLEEQRRIVAVLDKAFAGIAIATANAQKNLTNARALFEGYLDTLMQSIVVPAQKLGDICDRVTVGHVGITSPFYCEEGVPFLRTQNLTKSGINLDKLVYITEEFHRSLKKSALLPGDVLISRVVTDQMNVGVVPTGIGEANCANVIAVRPGRSVEPMFLKFLIESRSSQIELLGKKAGSAQQVVNTSILKNWLVRIPDLERQKIILKEISLFDRASQALQSRYQQTTIALSELKQSLLQKAFAGELT